MYQVSEVDPGHISSKAVNALIPKSLAGTDHWRRRYILVEEKVVTDGVGV
jgi:hypothetical protein